MSQTLTVRVLRLLARHPLASLGVALAAPVGAAALLLSSAHRSAPPAAVRVAPPAQVAPAAPPAQVAAPPAARTPAAAPLEDPALLLERPWFDKLPEAPSEKFSAWLLFDDGIGLYREGSSFRFQMDIVSHERKGEQLTVVTLDDNKKKETRFSITSCSDKPPFDLCLTFAQAPLGPTKLYSFKDSDQASNRIAWLKGFDRSAARTARFGLMR
jgi:hypothetical protein